MREAPTQQQQLPIQQKQQVQVAVCINPIC